MLSQYLTQLPKLKSQRSRPEQVTFVSPRLIISSCTDGPKAQSKTYLRQKPVLKHTSIVFGFLMDRDYPIDNVRYVRSPNSWRLRVCQVQNSISHVCDESNQIIDLLLRDDSFSHQLLPLSALRLSISMPARHVFGRRRLNNAKNLFEQKRAKKNA